MFVPYMGMISRTVSICLCIAPRCIECCLRWWQLWNLNFVWAGDIGTTFDVWFHAFPKGPKILIQRMAVALLLAIWRMRNMVVFTHGTFEEASCFEMFRFDLACWIKAEWIEHVPSVADLIRIPGCVEVPRKLMKIKRQWEWKPPSSSQIKVNVNGSCFGISGSAGIGSIFIDSDGIVLLQFGKAMRGGVGYSCGSSGFTERFTCDGGVWQISSHSFLFESYSKFIFSFGREPLAICVVISELVLRVFHCFRIWYLLFYLLYQHIRE